VLRQNEGTCSGNRALKVRVVSFSDSWRAKRKGEMAEARAWYAARDTFLGLNMKQQDLDRGLKLARECQHDDAEWLYRLFDRSTPVDAAAAKVVFLTQSNDMRATCFAGTVASFDEVLVRQSAEAGYALAQALLAGRGDRAEGLVWAQSAASQRDPMGLTRLAQFCWVGSVCEKDQHKAKALYREAAEMGQVSAMYNHAKRGLAEMDPERYVWLGRAAALGHHAAGMELTLAAEKQLGLFPVLQSGRLMFAIGEALQLHVSTTTETIFGLKCDQLYLESAQKVAKLHAEWVEDARIAIQCWLMIGKRQRGANKDIRMMVAKLLWRDRAVWSERAAKKGQRRQKK
jgi:TPR repeat protein